MTGNRWLRQFETVVHMTDAHFIIAEQREDTQTSLVGKRLEDVF